MKILGCFFLLLSLYGFYATYRILRYKELYWAYPNLRYRRKEGYSKTTCYIVGIPSIPITIFEFFLAIKLLLG